jgi:hypothetical protein
MKCESGVDRAKNHCTVITPHKPLARPRISNGHSRRNDPASGRFEPTTIREAKEKHSAALAVLHPPQSRRCNTTRAALCRIVVHGVYIYNGEAKLDRKERVSTLLISDQSV